VKYPGTRPEGALQRARRLSHPLLKEAVLADLALERRAYGATEPPTSKAALIAEFARLIFVSDAFGALVLYRIKAAAQRRGIPIVPILAHRAAMMWAQVCIGDGALIHPGVRLLHGQVVMGGFLEVNSGVQIRPFVTLGRRGSRVAGPTIGRDVHIGTGAKILGPVSVGDRAFVGANALVIDDVPAHTVVAGVPAREIRSSRT
jgi:serine O-acetyltransferase